MIALVLAAGLLENPAVAAVVVMLVAFPSIVFGLRAYHQAEESDEEAERQRKIIVDNQADIDEERESLRTRLQECRDAYAKLRTKHAAGK